MLHSQKYYHMMGHFTLLCTLLHTTCAYPEAAHATEADEITILAGESPGEGYGPDLVTDNEKTGGILSFVAPKGNRCEKLALQLTPAAIQDKVSMMISFHNRIPNNHKWEKDKSETDHYLIEEGKPITIFYNHAGHRGIHGGGTAKDTHHNWGIRLMKNNKYISADTSQWKKYIRIVYSSFRPTVENVYHGTEGIGFAYMTLAEAKKLGEWGLLSQAGEEVIYNIEEEINRLEQNDSDTVDEELRKTLETFGLALEMDEKDQWIIRGTKNKIKAPSTHECDKMGRQTKNDRIIVTLNK